jgi:hypothetical protein
MKVAPLVVVMIAAAVIFAVLAVLYGIGAIGLFTSTGGHEPHIKHAVVLAGLAVLSLVGANFARQRPA